MAPGPSRGAADRANSPRRLPIPQPGREEVPIREGRPRPWVVCADKRGDVRGPPRPRHPAAPHERLKDEPARNQARPAKGQPGGRGLGRNDNGSRQSAPPGSGTTPPDARRPRPPRYIQEKGIEAEKIGVPIVRQGEYS